MLGQNSNSCSLFPRPFLSFVRQDPLSSLGQGARGVLPHFFVEKNQK